MLLSIDRVLQLLAEGKSLDKIAELANCSTGDVSAVVEEARAIINKYEKPAGRKKVILKKGGLASGSQVEEEKPEIFAGAELAAVPVDSQLTIYTDGVSLGNPGKAGIGIVIFDKEERQVGKVSAAIGVATAAFAEYTALIRALKIALYFKVRSLKIRTDSEQMVKQIHGEYQVKHETIKKLHEEALELIEQIHTFRLEHVYSSQNDKADFLAKKACS